MSLVGGITLAIAGAALFLSVWNFWLSELRRGKLLLSRPTIFFFGWDNHNGEDYPKIMFRTALFSTANKGQILEGLHLKVMLGNSKWFFPFWGYDDGSGMVRGSGIFVGREGHVAYHHFNPIAELDDFSFEPGTYQIEILANTHGSNQDFVLGSYSFDLRGGEETTNLTRHEGGILWSWSPTDKVYVPEGSTRRAGNYASYSRGEPQ